MDNNEDNIIDITEAIADETDDEIINEDEIVDISEKTFIEAIYASGGVDVPACWLSFAPTGTYLALKDTIEWGHEERDGVTVMVPVYFEDVLGNSYVYVK